MTKPTDVRCIATELYFIPVQTRVPLKFGHEVLTSVTLARVKLTVADRAGRVAHGWGETPVSVQWVWPSALPFSERQRTLLDFCKVLAAEWAAFGATGHPMEIGYDFQRERLPLLMKQHNANYPPMPWLAALVCCSLFDIALHDAYGVLHNKPIYETYNAEFMNRDLAAFLDEPEKIFCGKYQPFSLEALSKLFVEKSNVAFHGKYPADYFLPAESSQLAAWHLVGGLDRIHASEPEGAAINDGYPNLLADWITRDGLTCLKIKLKGNDAAWDFKRTVDVGEIAIAHGVKWLSTDFNCTVENPDYVNAILDRLRAEQPRIFDMILYVEQPFPYELEEHPIDVHSVSVRKPLFLDESAHDWHMVRLGRKLGWTGVALKTCKTQTGAILSACFARAHGMALMVQDLTNPMLAMIPHAQLAAHVGTIMGVETNASQFYPEASAAEEKVHPGLYRRRNGQVDLSTLTGPGFGYRIEEIQHELGEPVCRFGSLNPA